MTKMFPSDLSLEAPHRHGRRGRRISSELWVQACGVEQTSIFRKGNISPSGVYVTSKVPAGSPGDLLMLRIASADQSKQARTVARVARVLRQDDRARGARVIATAFEFLPIDRPQPDITELVEHIAAYELDNFGGLRLDGETAATVRGEDSQSFHASIKVLGRTHITFRACAIAKVGQVLNVQVPYEGGVAVFEGQVLHALREEQGAEVCSIALRLSPSHEQQDAQLLELVRSLLKTGADRRHAASHYDFTGQLSQIGFEHVVELLRAEEYSGVLTCANDLQHYSFEVQHGEVMTVDAATGLSKSDALTRALLLQEGEFKFSNRRNIELNAKSARGARLLRDVLGFGAA